MKLEELVKKVKNMRDMSELMVGSVMVTRMDGDFGSEWKFSPFGSEGDYDRDCCWLVEEELETALADLLAESSPQSNNSDKIAVCQS